MLNKNSNLIREIIRTREIELVFNKFPQNYFEYSLEIGSGNGTQSRKLIYWTSHLLSTDINFNRLEYEINSNINYQICDANILPYKSETFDLIYSSNLLEHLLDPKLSLNEMHRVLKNEGIMIHIIPNQFWKLSHLLLFYPNQLLLLIRKLIGPKKPIEYNKNINNWSNIKNKPQKIKFLNKIWPKVHGEFKNHISEFAGMGYGNWENYFNKSSFKIIGYIDKLPVHSPYRFGLNKIRKFLEFLGFSSSHGFVLVKQSAQKDPMLPFNLKK